MEIDIWGTKDEKIAPQPFNLMIAVAVIEIVSSFCERFATSFFNTFFLFLGLMSHTMLLFFFRNYLRNFNSRSVLQWMNWNITINCMIFLFYAIIGFDTNSLYRHGYKYQVMVFLSLMIASIIIAIIYGRKLIQIRKDFIGLLKELGIFISIVLPIIAPLTSLLIIAIPFITRSSPTHSSVFLANYKKAIDIIQAIAGAIPALIMMLIFLRAKRYKRNSDTSV